MMAERMRPSVVKVETPRGSGSGVIVQVDNQTAIVLTNQHVIDRASSVTVVLSSGAQLSGEIVGYNASQDLAVLRVCCRSFQAAVTSADLPAPGETVFTMGYPLGVSNATVTRGVVSAIWEDNDAGRWLVADGRANQPRQ